MDLTKQEQLKINRYNNQIINDKNKRQQYITNLFHEKKHNHHFYMVIRQILNKMQVDYKFNQKLNEHNFKSLIHYIQHNMNISNKIYSHAMWIYFDTFKHLKSIKVSPLPKVNGVKNRNQFFDYEIKGLPNKIKELKDNINYNNLYFTNYPINIKSVPHTFYSYHKQKHILNKLLKSVSIKNNNSIITYLLNVHCYVSKHNPVFTTGKNIQDWLSIKPRTEVLKHLINKYINLGIDVKDINSNHKLNKIKKQIQIVNQSKVNYVQSCIKANVSSELDGTNTLIPWIIPITTFKSVVKPINNKFIIKMIKTILNHSEIDKTSKDLLLEKDKKAQDAYDKFFSPKRRIHKLFSKV